MNLLKLFLPKENMQTVTEIESWTVRWDVYDSYGRFKTQHKVFIKEDEAKEFVRQLNEQAEFIGVYIKIEKFRN